MDFSGERLSIGGLFRFSPSTLPALFEAQSAKFIRSDGDIWFAQHLNHGEILQRSGLEIARLHDAGSLLALLNLDGYHGEAGIFVSGDSDHLHEIYSYDLMEARIPTVEIMSAIVSGQLIKGKSIRVASL